MSASPFPQRHPRQPPSSLMVSAIRGLPFAGVGRPIFSPPCPQEELTEGLARHPELPLDSLLTFVLFGALTRPSVVRVCRATACSPGQGPAQLPTMAMPPALSGQPTLAPLMQTSQSVASCLPPQAVHPPMPAGVPAVRRLCLGLTNNHRA